MEQGFPIPPMARGQAVWSKMDFLGKKNSFFTAQVKHMIKHPHKIHGTIVYLPTCMVDFYGKQ